MAVSGVFAGALQESSGKFRENCWNIFPNREMLYIWDFGHQERQTCCKHWVHTALDLVPTFHAGCFSKLTVTAFSSFSEIVTATVRKVPRCLCNQCCRSKAVGCEEQPRGRRKNLALLCNRNWTRKLLKTKKDAA